MPVSCSAFGCVNRATPDAKEKGLSFHELPKDPIKRDNWIKAIRRKDWSPGPSARICSDHFQACEFDKMTVRRRLKPGAVPSVFPAFPSYFQQQQQEPRRVLKRHHDEPKRKHTLKDLCQLINHDHRYSKEGVVTK